jgi:hypothetical protein
MRRYTYLWHISLVASTLRCTRLLLTISAFIVIWELGVPRLVCLVLGLPWRDLWRSKVVLL